MFYLCCSFLPVTPCTWCFRDDSKGADGAADLLEVLGKATSLEKLDFDKCSQIPAAAWRRLHGAHWPNLKMAGFTQKLGRGCRDVSLKVDVLLHVVPASFVGRRKHMNWKNADITFPVTWGVAPVLLLVRQFEF